MRIRPTVTFVSLALVATTSAFVLSGSPATAASPTPAGYDSYSFGASNPSTFSFGASNPSTAKGPAAR